MPEAAAQQEPIEGLESARIRFAGMSLDELGNPPEIDDEMTFLVRAVCTGRGIQRMKDGELRRTATMEVLDVDPQGPPIKPSAAPNLFSIDEEDD
jgi:hypothetical protein